MRITVIGAAKSGLAAAHLAKRRGHDVFVTDAKPALAAASIIAELDAAGIAYEFGGHTDRALQADLIIASPGVPPSNVVRTAARERGTELIGELEWACRHLQNTIVAITGTNGKTTTTALTAHILRHAGRKAVAAGNIGTPLSALVDNIDADTIIVAEVSSYQLDTSVSFAPHVSILLNITPDHLTYHGSFEQYVDAKWKICRHQGPHDVVILNADDASAAGAAAVTQGTVQMISIRSEQHGAFVRGDEIILRVGGEHKEELLMAVRKIGVPGVHNVYNAMAAALAARALEVRNEDIRDALHSFAGVEHRLEYIRTLKGAKYYNDSKATNINAAWYALSSFDRPIVWIAGGRGDKNNYHELDELVATNVHAIVCIGEEADAIFNHWCTSKRCVKVRSLDEAVRTACELADPDDVVLFSPACKSFDMFDNFEQRGAAFKTLVGKL
ncbi:MAG: UDP-N-acetylmuramoyl-L-alanine--D-glutamate ligase [Candidatus Kapabacteria bacterium]|nr:UDP-N-acetylmuramoyl-L-alanine--D-glutamate ligase [Candidatus Kapabacteria bacterium]